MGKVVIFHHGDLDGFVSGAIVIKKLFADGEVTSFDDVILKEKQYGNDINYDVTDCIVYIVDFSFSPQQMLDLDAKAKSVVWIDHHVSAWGLVTLPFRNTSCYTSPSRSAALITWETLFPTVDVPALVKLTNDHDLWLEKYKDSHAINEIVKLRYNSPKKIYEAKLLDEKMYNSFTNLYSLAKLGHLIMEDKQRRVDSVINTGIWDKLGKYDAFYVNSQTDISLIGSTMTKKHPDKEFVVVIYSYKENGEAQVSLRSTTVDCAEIAQNYGGGGHVGAAGFRMKVVENGIINRIGERFGKKARGIRGKRAAQKLENV